MFLRKMENKLALTFASNSDRITFAEPVYMLFVYCLRLTVYT